MRTGFAVLVCLLIGLGTVAAEDKLKQPAEPLTSDQVADKVLAAFKAKDDAALKTLAEKDEPDPWLVAEELCYRGEHDAAEAFAKAAARVHVEKLPAYVMAWREREPDKAERDLMAAMDAAIASKQSEKVVKDTDALGPNLDTVMRIALASARGTALHGLHRLDESEPVLRSGADAALALGWLSRAAKLYGLAAESARMGSSGARALTNLTAKLAISERLGDKRLTALTQLSMGGVHGSLGRSTEALALYESARAALEALGERANLSGTLINMAALYAKQSDYEKALSSAERGLELATEMGNRPWSVNALHIIGSIHERRGDYTKSLVYQNRVLAEMTALGNRRGVAGAVGSVGNLHVHLGDYAKALSNYEQALAEVESLGDKRGVAAALGNIGIVHQYLGNFAKALSTFERVLAQMEALGDKAAAAGSLVNIGMVYGCLGDYAKELSTLERGLDLAEKIGHRQWAANALANIGSVHATLGDYDKALSTFEKALAQLESMGDKAGVAVALVNIGSIHTSLGDYAKALSSFERGLELAEKIGNRRGAVNALANMGGLHSSLGDYDKALSTYERALAEQQALGEKHGAAETLANIGDAYRLLGDYTRARSFAEKSARAAKSLRATPLLIRALMILTRVHLDTDKPSRALAAAKEALAAVESLLGGLGEEQGATAREQFAGLFAIGTLAAVRDDDVAEALAFLESGRAGALLDALDKREVLRWKAESLPPELRRLDLEAQAKESAARHAYDQAAKRGKMKETRAAAEALDKATEAVHAIAGRIQRELKQQAGLFYPRAKTLEEIKSELQEEQALVLYGLFLDDKEDMDEALALVLGPDGERVVSLGRASEIAAACEALDATSASTDPSAALDALRKLVVDPLKLGKGVKQVLVSPEGPLCYLPFGAMFEQTVAMTPSGTTHALLLSEERAQGEGVLALGDPDYGGASKGAQEIYYRGRTLSPLPATRKEVETIGTQTLLGAKASEAGLREALPEAKRWRAVHFACHGLVNIDKPMLSSLVLTNAGEDDGFLTALEVLRMKIPADLAVLSACETATGKIVKGEGIVGLTRAFMFAGAPRVICSLWKVDDEATQALMVKFYELWSGEAALSKAPGAASNGSKGVEGAASNASNGDATKGLGAAAALKKAQEFIRDHLDKDGKRHWEHPYYWAAWVLWGLSD